MVFAKKNIASKAPTSRTAKRTPVKKITFKAPSDFKPCFIEVMFKVGADGLASPHIKMERVQGRWDNPDAKRFNLFEYDVQTALALTGRLFGRYFVVNQAKRLPANSSYKLVIRVGKRSADNTLSSSVKEAAYLYKKEGMKPKWKWYSDKKDPTFRKLRSVSRFLAGAFTNIQLPPVKSRRNATED